ncbi:MAG TPA: hypothetical protein PK644_08720, partial [bacterium]|nr:hypothetical protein [bacterium]
MGGTGSLEEVKKFAADPMNQLIVKLVKEKGVRQARGLTDGLSRLDNYLVTVPEYRGKVVLVHPEDRYIAGARHLFSGKKVWTKHDRHGRPVLQLEPGTAYEVI